MTIGLLKLRVLAARFLEQFTFCPNAKSCAYGCRSANSSEPWRYMPAVSGLSGPERIPGRTGSCRFKKQHNLVPATAKCHACCSKQKKWRSVKRRSAHAFPGGNIYKTHHASTAFLFTRTIL